METLKKPAKPVYSIIIPAFNEEVLLGDCLQSLVKQNTSEEYEVIVVDNNSTDNTATIARQYGARVIKEKNAGVCWARQAGLEAAKGQIIISTDADSTFPVNWLSKISKKINRPGVVAVGGPVIYTGDIWWANAWSKALFGFSDLWRKIFGQPSYISACNLAYRRFAVKAYETNLTQGGDEFAILSQLKDHGKVVLDRKNIVRTSGRRQSRGLLYTFFVTLLWYYVLGYTLSKLTKRTVFGGYPAFRDVRTGSRGASLAQALSGFALFALVVISYSRATHTGVAHALSRIPHEINEHVRK